MAQGNNVLDYLKKVFPRTGLKALSNTLSGVESLITTPTQLLNVGLSKLTGQDMIPGKTESIESYLSEGPEGDVARQLLKSRGIDISQEQSLAPFESREEKQERYKETIKPAAEKFLGKDALESQNVGERYTDRIIPAVVESMMFGVKPAATAVGNILGQTAKEAGLGPLADLAATVLGSLGYSAFKSPSRIKDFAEKESTRLYNESRKLAGDKRVEASSVLNRIKEHSKELPDKVSRKLATEGDKEVREFLSKFYKKDIKLQDLVKMEQKLNSFINGKEKQAPALIDNLYKPIKESISEFVKDVPGNPEFSQAYTSAKNIYAGLQQGGSLQKTLDTVGKKIGPLAKMFFGGAAVGGGARSLVKHPLIGAGSAATIYGLKKADDVASLISRISQSPGVEDAMKKMGDLLLKENIPAAADAMRQIDKIFKKEAPKIAKEIKEANKNDISQHPSFSVERTQVDVDEIIKDPSFMVERSQR